MSDLQTLGKEEGDHRRKIGALVPDMIRGVKKNKEGRREVTGERKGPRWRGSHIPREGGKKPEG